MKQIIKSLAIAVVMLAFAGTVQAQSATATSNAAAVIIAPLSITNTAGLHFGTIMRSATAGTVSIATDGTRSSLGGVTLSALAPVHSVATFNLEGESGNEVLITLPASTTISNGTQTMTVDDFVSNPDDANPVTLGGVATVLSVGATLNVAAGQASGAYTGTFDVTVNYN
ncbi:MAG: DUF4402 domain-containing protein [Bacteroidales bacterium]|jgi:hypothetical protein|nr:DUF4402 domain-containing protein [Bacteroidales bacterium]